MPPGSLPVEVSGSDLNSLIRTRSLPGWPGPGRSSVEASLTESGPRRWARARRNGAMALPGRTTPEPGPLHRLPATGNRSSDFSWFSSLTSTLAAAMSYNLTDCRGPARRACPTLSESRTLNFESTQCISHAGFKLQCHNYYIVTRVLSRREEFKAGATRQLCEARADGTQKNVIKRKRLSLDTGLDEN
jgi:hypothetical protein